MATANKKLEHIRLEEYLTNQFDFRSNEITGSIEFKKKMELHWEELNEFNIYRQLRLEGFKSNLNELIYLLKSDYVAKYNPFSYFQSLPVWTSESEDYIKKLCSYVKLRSAARFERHFKNGWLGVLSVLWKTCIVIKMQSFLCMNYKIPERRLLSGFYVHPL